MSNRTPYVQNIHDSLIAYVIQSGRVAEAMKDFPRYSDHILGELCERFMSNNLICRNLTYTWIKEMFSKNTVVTFRAADPVLNSEVAQTHTCPATCQSFSLSVKDSASWSTFVAGRMDTVRPAAHSSRVNVSRPKHKRIEHTQTKRMLETSVKMQFSLADGECAYWFEEDQVKTTGNRWICERVKQLACLPCTLHVKGNNYYPWDWKEFITYARCNYPGCGTFIIAKLRGSDSVVVEMKGLKNHPETKLRTLSMPHVSRVAVKVRDRRVRKLMRGKSWKIPNNRGR